MCGGWGDAQGYIVTRARQGSHMMARRRRGGFGAGGLGSLEMKLKPLYCESSEIHRTQSLYQLCFIMKVQRCSPKKS